MARLIRASELSARDVLAAHLAHIERVNPTVNAIVTLIADQAMDRAAADEALARGEAVGPLHGSADCAQGFAADKGDPHDVRLADLQGLRAGGRFAARRAHAPGRRDCDRQDEHAGVRRRIADAAEDQDDVRPHVRTPPQPVHPADRRRADRACLVAAIASKPTKLGLDLQGGVSARLPGQADQAAAEAGRRTRSTAAVDIIRERVDVLGVAEPSIARSGRDQIEVDLPGGQGRRSARADQVGTTAQLYFYDWEKNLLDSGLQERTRT